MTDLISRQEAIDALKRHFSDAGSTDTEYGAYWHHRHVLAVIDELPSAEPERKKGKWTKDCACEICGFKPWYERDIHTLSFCPNCGADMREREGE